MQRYNWIPTFVGMEKEDSLRYLGLTVESPRPSAEG